MVSKRTLRRAIAYTAGVTLLLCGGVEGALRWYGLGDPPLYVLDKDIEYYAKHGSYRRYGNYVHINSFGMRSAEVRQKTDQVRILLLGDSIVFGTYRVNQDELISSFLEPELSRLLKRDVEVLNVASSSWGPLNQEAYLERFGIFQSDCVVWILSSHDAYDVPIPGFADLLPQEPGFTALGEAFDKLREKRFVAPASSGDPLERSLVAVRHVISLFSRARVPVLAAQHWSTEELARGMDKEGLVLRDLFEKLSVPVMSLKPAVLEAQQTASPYQDTLHVSPAGARAIGHAIARELQRYRAMLLEPTGARATRAKGVRED